MRPEPNLRVEQYRINDFECEEMKSPTGVNWGAFAYPLLDGSELHIISSGEDDMYHWEHVSVSHPRRCPTWDEMHKIKQLFWTDEEVVMQLHPPQSCYVNLHPFCLHMWRPVKAEIPLPPSILL